MGKSGNPARAAAEDTPLVKQTMKAMRATINLVRTMENTTDIHPETLLLTKAAAAGLLASYAAQTGLPAPWDINLKGTTP